MDILDKILYHVSMESRKSKKEQILDKFTAYVEDNPGVSYAEASKVMQRTSKTIHRWCEELGIKLTTPQAVDRPTLTLESTAGEEKIPDELSEVIDEASGNVEYIQEQILLKDSQIAELQNQIVSDKNVIERQKKEFDMTILEKEKEIYTQIRQDYNTVLQDTQKVKENKAAAAEANKRVREQTLSARERLDWEMANMNKVAEVQRNLATAESKTQSQPLSSLDEIGKLVTITDALEERAASRRPAQTSSGGISYQASNMEEYEKLLDIEYKRSGKQARDEMVKGVISPLKDYLFQKFGFGLPPQGAQQISPQQTVFQQQPMPAQPWQPIQPTQEFSYEPPKPQAPQPQMVYVFRSSDQYDVTCPVCGTSVAVALDSISVNRCSGCNTPVLAVEDSPENSEYIGQMKSNQWTEELTDKIKLAAQRFNEVTMSGLGLDTQPLVNKGKSTGDDALMGTFLAMAVREGVKKYLGEVSANTANSLVEKNMDIETIWKMIPQGFKQTMATYANENPNQLRYVLDPPWVIDAIRESNPSLAEYFTNHSLGKAWLNKVILDVKVRLNI